MSESRKITRGIAKERLRAMGVKHVNKNLGQGLSQHKNKVYQRTEYGRYLIAKFAKEHPPLWRRVTTGDLAKAGYRAQFGIGPKRRYMVTR